MNKPVLIVMAAGLGSRYGGLKQMEPVDDAGHIIIDYSIYDAYRAGFETVIFIVAEKNEQDFRETVGKRVSSRMNVEYAVQRPDALPDGFTVPEGRVKPWGTAHAVLSAKGLVSSAFAAINADDFYGATAFKEIYDFLENRVNASHHAMVGYNIENTLTENGHVARGVCKVDGDGNLLEIVERTHIEKRHEGAAYTEDDGESFTFLPAGTTVSMNMWGFDKTMMDEIENRFAGFLAENLPKNPLKCEYFLPYIPNALLNEGKSDIKVLPTPDKWYGITYSDDMPVVKQAIAQMRSSGTYPEKLWAAANRR